jgi:hypothetical protein
LYTKKKVYNFEVADWHTYFVEAWEWLVHNTDICLSSVKNFKWGKYLKSLIGPPPKWMKNAHAHHIVFKEGRGVMKKYVNESKKILEKHDIDWLKGVENLVWAPNKNHSTKAAKAVRNALKEADKLGKNEVVKTLKELGEKFADDTINTLF